jgi:hypothetical protein
MDSAAEYLVEALECEEKAARATGGEARQILLHTAYRWRALARDLDELRPPKAVCSTPRSPLFRR